MLTRTVPSANAVADWFLARGVQEPPTQISHLKLQKLCYYAQGYHLALLGGGLFKDDIEAWQHGPVVRSVYNRFRGCGRASIAPRPGFDPMVFTNDQVQVLEQVYQDQGPRSAWTLREQTHAEAPWRDIYGSGTTIISEQSMRAWFIQAGLPGLANV
jgi:uncharacterized phage-associated protein